MCIVFFIIKHVYWYLRVTLSSMFVGESSYVSFLRSSLFCIHFITFVFKVRNERPSLKGSRSLSFPSLYWLLMWLLLHILIWVYHHSFLCVHHFVIILAIVLDSSSSFHPLFFPYNDLFWVWFFLCIILIHLFINSICFIVSLLILYSHWAPLGPRLMRFSTHVAFYTWGYGFWSLGIWA